MFPSPVSLLGEILEHVQTKSVVGLEISVRCELGSEPAQSNFSGKNRIEPIFESNIGLSRLNRKGGGKKKKRKEEGKKRKEFEKLDSD